MTMFVISLTSFYSKNSSIFFSQLVHKEGISWKIIKWNLEVVYEGVWT